MHVKYREHTACAPKLIPARRGKEGRWMHALQRWAVPVSAAWRQHPAALTCPLRCHVPAFSLPFQCASLATPTHEALNQKATFKNNAAISLPLTRAKNPCSHVFVQFGLPRLPTIHSSRLRVYPPPSSEHVATPWCRRPHMRAARHTGQQTTTTVSLVMLSMGSPPVAR